MIPSRITENSIALGMKEAVSAPAEAARVRTAEHLPFTIELVETEAQLAKAVYIRQKAYARHLPEFASGLQTPEPYDFEPGCAVFLAESKLDGSPVGSIRVQTNHYARLKLEQSVELPDELAQRSLAEITRLGITLGHAGRLVKVALFKAMQLYCQVAQIDSMVVCMRAPLDKPYFDLGFEDVYPSGEYIPMPHIGNIPHRVLALNVATLERRWHETHHPLHKFFFRTFHPDIRPFGRSPLTAPAVVEKTAHQTHLRPELG
ncbi:MAG TPA: hypothetical protein VFS42_10250 [Burkholderiaceae bacterium]|nr:hypothetical protein [Burkholderiaceae bacterium]